MPGFLDAAEIPIPCEKCGRTTKKSIGWLKTHRELTCTCGTHIRLDADDLRRKVADMERSLKRAFK